jgi:hypothetical protein
MKNRTGEHFPRNFAAEQALPLLSDTKQLCWKREALNYPKLTTITYEPLLSIPGSPGTELRVFKTTEMLVTTADEGCRLCQRLLHVLSRIGNFVLNQDPREFQSACDLYSTRPGDRLDHQVRGWGNTSIITIL